MSELPAGVLAFDTVQYCFVCCRFDAAEYVLHPGPRHRFHTRELLPLTT